MFHYITKLFSKTKNIEDEFFIPNDGLVISNYIKKKDVAAVHHLIRYQWAVKVIEHMNLQKPLLDVACGAGYGSFQIAKNYPDIQVIGVDYDPKAIKYASENYVLPNLNFKQGDLQYWDDTIGNEKFEVIISFDTIEHVLHREIVMENFLSHLEDNGVLLISTPCGEKYNNLQPDWWAHKIEYSSKSLFDLLSRYFLTIIRPEDEIFPNKNVFDQLDGSGINYLLQMNPVICRNPIRINNPYQ